LPAGIDIVGIYDGSSGLLEADIKARLAQVTEVFGTPSPILVKPASALGEGLKLWVKKTPEKTLEETAAFTGEFARQEVDKHTHTYAPFDISSFWLRVRSQNLA
jgi:hypothetical protein